MVDDAVDPAALEVMKKRATTAVDRLLRDCRRLGTPDPEFTIRVGQERVPGFEERNASWIGRHLARLDPAGVCIYVSVPPDRSYAMFQCTVDRSVDELCALLAEELQELIIEGPLWGASWPLCPVHQSHPVWPQIVEGEAVWSCSEAPGFAELIGDLGAEP